MSNIILVDNDNQLERLINSSLWNTIYISIGGKWNENDNNSNAFYQMVPAFIRNTSFPNVTSLVIVCDDFSDKTNTNKNVKTLQDQLQQHPHVTICLVNKLVTPKWFQKLCHHLCKLLHTSHHSLSDLKIVNYVKYKHIPNKKEAINRKNLQSIYNIIKHYNLDHCYYEWFGYNDKLNNYIYNCQIVECPNYIRNVGLLEKFLHNKTATINNLSVIQLLNYIVPITTNSRVDEAMSISIDSNYNRYRRYL
jgi:hypothetical protein